jgi:paired amphipathic helix protein Sin3a
MMIQLWDKDASSSEMLKLDQNRRWQHYVNSYASVEPTEGIPTDKVRLPVLKDHLVIDTTEDLVTKLGEVDMDEDLQFTVQIKNDGWRIKFKEGVETIVRHPSAIPANNSTAQRRQEVAADKFLVNSRWMRGMNKDVVDKFKADFEHRLSDENYKPQDVDVTTNVATTTTAAVPVEAPADHDGDAHMAEVEA